MAVEHTWCPQCHSPLSTVVVRSPAPARRLVGGEVGEDRMLELMARLSAVEQVGAGPGWLRRGSSGPSVTSRILLALGGIGAVLAVLMALMWLTGALL